MKKLIQNIFRPKPTPSLIDLDDLYRNTIQYLPDETRLHYCSNLIENCKLDIEQAKMKMKIDNLKALIKASLSEIEKLRKLTCPKMG